MTKTKKVSSAKIEEKKKELKAILKKKMPGCFFSTVREDYEEGKLDELIEEILAKK